MRRASWKAQFVLGMLLPSVTFADDELAKNADSALLPQSSPSIETLLAEPVYAPRWQLVQPGTAAQQTETWLRPLDDVDFQDGSMLGRLSRLRNLSFLTLAEIGGSRLFLGVNEDGLAGLHFNAFSRSAGERFVEVVRMPYLKDDAPESGADDTTRQSN